MKNFKTIIWSSLGGILVGMFALSYMFGFMSNNSATEMAKRAAMDATISALVPMCVTNAQAEPEKVAEVLAMSARQRFTGVSKAEWATYPAGANSATKRAIDEACALALSVP